MATQFIVATDAPSTARQARGALAAGERRDGRPARRAHPLARRGRPLRRPARGPRRRADRREPRLAGQRPARAATISAHWPESRLRSSPRRSPRTSRRSPPRPASPRPADASCRSSRAPLRTARRSGSISSATRSSTSRTGSPASCSAAASSPGCRPGSWCRRTCATATRICVALCEWAADRDVPLAIRLVKGAYWDTETVVARGRLLARPRLRAQGRDRRELRALRAAPALVPRPGASRLRLAQPEVARLCDRGRPRGGDPRPRLRGAAAVGHGRARARGVPPPRLPSAGLRADGRARAGDGLSRAPPAREHLERELRAAAFRRAQGPQLARARRRWPISPPSRRTCSRRPSSRRPRDRRRASRARTIPSRSSDGSRPRRRAR